MMIERRKIGSLETFPLILGGNVFGWTTGRDAGFRVLDAFFAGGGRMVDTADLYFGDFGASESLIGDWLRSRRRRNDVLIATKVGMLPGAGGEKLAPTRIAAAVEESLRRLGTDYIDLYIAHQDDEGQSQEAVAEAFNAIVQAGKAREIGASNFSADRLATALQAQTATGAARYVSLQNQYNLMERRSFEGPVQDVCVQHGIAMTPYYSLAAGYLTGKYRSASDLKGGARDRAGVKYMAQGGPRVLAALDQVAQEIGASCAQVALAWLMAQPGVVAPIASATTSTQAEELIGATALQLSEDQLSTLDQASTFISADM